MGKVTKEQQLLNRYALLAHLDFPVAFCDDRDEEIHEMLEDALGIFFYLDLEGR